MISIVLVNGFQSTHPHGVRLNTELVTWQAVLFQSTHPHGVRQITFNALSKDEGFNPRTHTGCDSVSDSINVKVRRFNPRTHTGCDMQESKGFILQRVSIHAPTRGATPTLARRGFTELSFNPRTHTGCDLCKLSQLRAFQVSIHAPTRGATLLNALSNTEQMFQSTHPHGVRPDTRGIKTPWSSFNPRTHTGCDK